MRMYENYILNHGVTFPNQIGVKTFTVGGCNGSRDTRFRDMGITKIGFCRQYIMDTRVCFIRNCVKAANCGGHMVFVHNGCKYLCIIPICRRHNNNKFNFERRQRLSLKDGYPVIIIPWW